VRLFIQVIKEIKAGVYASGHRYVHVDPEVLMTGEFVEEVAIHGADLESPHCCLKIVEIKPGSPALAPSISDKSSGHKMERQKNRSVCDEYLSEDDLTLMENKLLEAPSKALVMTGCDRIGRGTGHQISVTIALSESLFDEVWWLCKDAIRYELALGFSLGPYEFGSDAEGGEGDRSAALEKFIGGIGEQDTLHGERYFSTEFSCHLTGIPGRG